MRAWVRAYLLVASRIARGTQYVGLTAAGAWLMTTPTALLHTAMGTVVYGWALFLVLGGTLCTLGTATKLWIGEFTGLVLLMTANLTWGLALIQAGQSSAKYGIVLVAWFCGLLARELEIFNTARTAAKIGRRRSAGGELSG